MRTAASFKVEGTPLKVTLILFLISLSFVMKNYDTKMQAMHLEMLKIPL